MISLFLCLSRFLLMPPAPIEVHYRPLTLPSPSAAASASSQSSPRKATLTLTSPVLGDYVYAVELTVTGPGNAGDVGAGGGAESSGGGELQQSSASSSASAAVRCECSLGASTVSQYRFISFSPTAGEYECKVNTEEFSVEPKFKVKGCKRGSEGEEVMLDIRYEPSALGDVRDVLTISIPASKMPAVASASAGASGQFEFHVPLLGHCRSPQPQGPFIIRLGAPTSIPFKNVFTRQQDFTFVCDSPAFSVVGKKSEKVAPRKVFPIAVSFTPPSALSSSGAAAAKPTTPVPSSSSASSSAVVSGKLVVSCEGVPPWIFYLRGLQPSSSSVPATKSS